MPLDLDTGRGLAMGLLPEILLTGWALLLVLLAAWRHGEPGAQRQVGWLSLLGLAATAAAVVWLWAKGAHIEGLATNVAVDAFRWAVDLIVLLGAALTILLSLDYLDREGFRIPEYHVMVLFAAVGMMLLAGGADLMVVFLGLELMSVSVYVLAGINRRSAVGAEAALKYFLLGAFASAFFLYGIALVYGATGTTKLAVMDFQVSSLGIERHPMLVAGLALLFIGFAFKVAAVPFHMWAPDVYDGSPSPVTAFMAAAVKAAAFGALVRLLLMGFSNLHASWDTVIWWLAAATMVVGNLVALAQRALKRMLAYSSVAHAGYLLTALVSGSLAGAAAFLFYLLFYTLMTVGAFAVLIAKGRGGERDVTTDDLAGLAESNPGLAFTMAVCMLSLLGFPGTAGFIGKWYILTSATGSGYAILASVLVLASVVSAGYYLPVIMAMYMKPRLHEQAHAEVKLPGVVRGMLAAVVVALLLFGLWPNTLLDAARDGSHAFLPAGTATAVAPVTTPH
ncbi:MAG: NADH-quinone oxidoreductase subunit N [Gemmatimonadetes bacterium]|nr:NADH-quinone oxidoreductase subunit N [Gemmatimonadota bacterium]